MQKGKKVVALSRKIPPLLRIISNGPRIGKGDALKIWALIFMVIERGKYGSKKVFVIFIT